MGTVSGNQLESVRERTGIKTQRRIETHNEIKEGREEEGGRL